MLHTDPQTDGAFLVRLRTPLKSLSEHIEIDIPPEPNPICRGANRAATLRNYRLTTFCDAAFGGENLYVTKSRINPGDALNDKLTLSHLWIHEWGHLFNYCAF